MTKADLVEQVADVIGPRVTKRDCGLAVDAFLDAVKEALARGDGIELRGFGTFKVRHRKGRTGRNPRTGEAVEVPPRDVPVFKPSRRNTRSLNHGRRSRKFNQDCTICHSCRWRTSDPNVPKYRETRVLWREAEA